MTCEVADGGGSSQRICIYLVLLYHTAETDLSVLGAGNGHRISGFCFCKRTYPSYVSFPWRTETGRFWDYCGQRAGDCVASLYVWNDPDRGLILKKRDER